ncbi:hypothetical protein BU230_18165 [Klebsiella pneumoniae]|nr:hypothetical protein BU230_18165 [Klebsiella pneumoniae]
MGKRKGFLSWKEFLIVIVCFVCTPVILNYVLFTWRAPRVYGDGDTWLGFWGNYSGAFVGALVALWIAKRQINDSRELELEKEQRQRKLAQLPSLVFLKYEMSWMIKELEVALENRNGYASVDEKSGELLKDLSEDEKRAHLYRAEDKIYDVKQTNTESYSYIANIESFDLHVSLIECFNFHKEFSEVVSQSHSVRLAELESDLQFEKHHENPTEESAIIAKQKFFKRFELNVVKRRVWERLEKENQIDKFKETNKMLLKELDEVKRLHNSLN